MSEDAKIQSLVNEEERKKLINEIARIKDVLDSFKYGLNFEQFADELFKTIEKQTVEMKRLKSSMLQIEERMSSLERTLKEGIAVRLQDGGVDLADFEETDFTIGDEEKTEPNDESEEIHSENREQLDEKAKELSSKIARLFEKENELLEMALNDPAGAEEYEKKAAVARQMREDLESDLEEIREKLD